MSTSGHALSATYAPRYGGFPSKAWLDRWATEAFAAPPAEDTPTVAYTLSTTSAITTPKERKPNIVGTGAQVRDWNGQNDPYFRFGGGVYETRNGANNDLALVGQIKPGGNAQFARWPIFMSFETASSVVEITHYALSTTDTPMFRINGRWLSDVNTTRGATGNSFMTTLTFPSNKVRRIELVGGGGVSVIAVRVPNTHDIWKPIDLVTRRIAVIGDSYVNGSGAASSGGAGTLETFAPRLAHMMGADETILAGIGGAGWVAGLDGSTPNNYSTRLSTVLAMNPHVLVFYGSINDGTAGTGVQAAVESALATCAAVPEIYVIGPVLRQYEPANLAVRAGTLAKDRRFIDLRTFIGGTGRVGATTGVGNGDYYLMSDGSHPTFEAHKALARAAFLGAHGAYSHAA